MSTPLMRCSMCLEPRELHVITSCCHTACSPCLLALLGTKEEATCHLCRKVFKKIEVKQLFIPSLEDDNCSRAASAAHAAASAVVFPPPWTYEATTASVKRGQLINEVIQQLNTYTITTDLINSCESSCMSVKAIPFDVLATISQNYAPVWETLFHDLRDRSFTLQDVRIQVTPGAPPACYWTALMEVLQKNDYSLAFFLSALRGLSAHLSSLSEAALAADAANHSLLKTKAYRILLRAGMPNNEKFASFYDLINKNRESLANKLASAFVIIKDFDPRTCEFVRGSLCKYPQYALRFAHGAELLYNEGIRYNTCPEVYHIICPRVFDDLDKLLTTHSSASRAAYYHLNHRPQDAAFLASVRLARARTEFMEPEVRELANRLISQQPCIANSIVKAYVILSQAGISYSTHQKEFNDVFIYSQPEKILSRARKMALQDGPNTGVN